MKRRNFLQNTAALGLPVLLGGTPVRALGKSSGLSYLLSHSAAEGKVLVLIQLNGGNDGLAMLPPIDQYDKLSRVRNNIMVPEQQLLKLDHATGLHPTMAGIHRLWEQEKLCVVQSVGYPSPNFSHFRSTDIWVTGSASDENLSSGWMGRYMEREYPGFPEAYPNPQHPDPLAITIGSVVSNTCQGRVGNFGIAIQDPEQFSKLQDGSFEQEIPDTPYGHELEFLNLTIRQTNQYAETIARAWAKSQTQSKLYPDKNNKLSDQLKIVARMIHGGLQTPVYIVNLGGFDTHANQVSQGQNTATTGRHATLLRTLAEAISAFQDDLEKMGLEDRVIGMTFSEFGRRIASNDSFGTDHGAAAPLFVFGTQVSPHIFGSSPAIPQRAGRKDSLPMQFDFRSIYGSVLMDWFEVEESLIRELLYDDFQYVPILGEFPGPLTDEHVNVLAYPNPFRGSAYISFELEQVSRAKVQVFNSIGQEIRLLTDRNLVPGRHKIVFSANGIAPGTYHIRVQLGDYQEVKTLLCTG